MSRTFKPLIGCLCITGFCVLLAANVICGNWLTVGSLCLAALSCKM